MRRRWPLFPIIGLALLSAPAPTDPHTKTIALSSIELPDAALVDSNWIRLDASARATFDSAAHHWLDSLITVGLRDAGLHVLPSPIAAGIWRRLVDSVQGFYDPLTGALVEEEYRAVVLGTARALRAQHGADAWVRPRVELVPVAFRGGSVQWDGTSEGLGARLKGRSSATSIVVELIDSTGMPRASGRGGLKALVHAPSGRPERVAWTSIFVDQKRNHRAVTLALETVIEYLAGGEPQR